MNITEGRISRNIIHLAVPAMASMVSIMLFEFIDLFWIGKLGAEAVAALGAASFMVWALKSLANCVAAGMNALIARNSGAGNRGRVTMWASQGMLLTIIFSLVIAAMTLSINLFLFDSLGLADRVARMARDYTFVIALGLPFIFLLVSSENIFRASGNTFIPMVIMIFSLMLNAVLDPFFIYGWFGFPKMGMQGAAVASIISHTAGFILLVLKLPAQNIRLSSDLHKFIANSKEILRIGMPIGILGAVFSVIYIFISRIIAYFGTVPMAAISICHRIEGIPFFVAFGFSTAVSALVGQNLGAGKADRAQKAVNISLMYASGFLLFTSAIFILFGKSLLSLFIDNQAVIDEGYRYLFAVSIFEIFLGPEIILEGAFTGAGDTKPPFLISIPLTFLRIPVAYLLAVTFGFGVVSIWWTISITTFFKGTAFFLWFRRGKWKDSTIG